MGKREDREGIAGNCDKEFAVKCNGCPEYDYCLGYSHGAKDTLAAEQVCPVCNGEKLVPDPTGQYHLMPCPACYGTGTKEGWYEQQIKELKAEVERLTQELKDVVKGAVKMEADQQKRITQLVDLLEELEPCYTRPDMLATPELISEISVTLVSIQSEQIPPPLKDQPSFIPAIGISTDDNEQEARICETCGLNHQGSKLCVGCDDDFSNWRPEERAVPK